MFCGSETIIVNARFLTQKITGVQRFAIEISLKLKEILGDRIEFVAPDNILETEYAEKLGAVCVGNNTGHIWEQIELPIYLNSIGSPLLICLCNTAPLIYKNKISTIHDIAFEVFPETFSKAFRLVYKFLIPRITKSSRHIFTVSYFSKNEIVKYYGIDEEKISVIYNAVAAEFRHVEDDSLRKEHFFLAVSSLNHRKNFIAVLKAFQELRPTISDVKLYIVGDLDCSNFKGVNLEEYTSNPDIRFLGRVSDEDLIRYYSNAEAFVYPSLYEGFGIPPLEAQSCGCPVLVSDIPPLKEVIGDSGIYCNPYSIEDICNGMKKVLEVSGLKEKGKENVKNFSWERSAYNIISHVDALCKVD